MRAIDRQKYRSTYKLTTEILFKEGNELYSNFEYNVFCFYAKKQYVIGLVYSAPYRVDDTPSFGIYIPTSVGVSSLMFKDLATGKYGNCVDFVCEMLKIRKERALAKISKDFSLGLVAGQGLNKAKIQKYETYEPEILEKPEIGVFNKKNFSSGDLLYWSKFHIKEPTLNKYHVRPVSYVTMDGKVVYNSSTTDPAFDYWEDVEGNIEHKIYRPLSKKYKFRNYFTKQVVVGFEQLPEGRLDTIFIDASRKDIMSMDIMGFNAVAGLSETIMIKDDIIVDLKEKANRLIVGLDNDIAGQLMAEKYKKIHDLELLVYPSNFPKDKADLIEEVGPEEGARIITSLIN